MIDKIKNSVITSIGEDTEKKELSDTLHGNANWYNFGKQLAISDIIEDMHSVWPNNRTPRLIFHLNVCRCAAGDIY